MEEAMKLKTKDKARMKFAIMDFGNGWRVVSLNPNKIHSKSMGRDAALKLARKMNNLEKRKGNRT